MSNGIIPASINDKVDYQESGCLCLETRFKRIKKFNKAAKLSWVKTDPVLETLNLDILAVDKLTASEIHYKK